MKYFIFPIAVCLCVSSIFGASIMPYAPIAKESGIALDRKAEDQRNSMIGEIRVNQAGYLPTDADKLFYYVGKAKSFTVVLALDSSAIASGELSSTGQITESSIKIIADTYLTKEYTFNGSGPTDTLRVGRLPGGLPEDTPLRIKVDAVYSADFIISPKIYTYVKNAGLRFFGLQQSKHSLDTIPGGWYDAGDYLKESISQSYAASVLAVIAATHQSKDQDQYDATQSNPVTTDGIPDILAEAKHGADFVLTAYDYANGEIDDMRVSIGDFGKDHGFWNLPTVQQALDPSVIGRGGPHERPARLGELGVDVSARFAANLAIVSKLYGVHDKAYASKCLSVAKKLYAFAKDFALGNISPTNNTHMIVSSPAYAGNSTYNDKLALAAIALLYATQDTNYLHDATEDKSFPSVGQTKSDYLNTKGGAGAFYGGWFAINSPSLLKNAMNTDWSTSHTFALYAFYKLILSDQNAAQSYGISAARRLQYIEDVALTLAANLSSISFGSSGTKIAFPQGALGWITNSLSYEPIWFQLSTGGDWLYNADHLGSSFEVLAYSDIAKYAESITLPNLGKIDWKSKETAQLGLNMMNYVFGLNPWDICFMYGIGDKNDQHPHHRQSNPDGRNLGSEYEYTVPVGAVYSGKAPSDVNFLGSDKASWQDYQLSSIGLQDASSLLAASALLANGSKINTTALLNPASNPLVKHQLHAKMVQSTLQVTATLPSSQPVFVRVLDLGGKTTFNQQFQGLTGVNHWRLDIGRTAGIRIVKISSGTLENSILMSP